MTSQRAPLFLAVAFCVFFAGFSATAQSKRTKEPATQVIVVEPIDLQGLKSLVKREPTKAQPLLINFWATWCDPCRDEFPDLVKIDRDYRSKGLQFVAISLDDPPEIKTSVPAFLKQMGATMPSYLLNTSDPEPAITFVDPRWSGALPATILYDAAGNIAFKHFGRVNPTELRLAIDKTLTSNK